MTLTQSNGFGAQQELIFKQLSVLRAFELSLPVVLGLIFFLPWEWTSTAQGKSDRVRRSWGKRKKNGKTLFLFQFLWSVFHRFYRPGLPFIVPNKPEDQTNRSATNLHLELENIHKLTEREMKTNGLNLSLLVLSIPNGHLIVGPTNQIGIAPLDFY